MSPGFFVKSEYMPIPKPRKDEERDDFVSRCAGDSEMNSEYPDQKQRLAICNTQWRRKDEAKEVTKEFAESIRFVEPVIDESTEATGGDVWLVDIIKEGLNLSGTREYTKGALESMVPFVNGLQAFVDHPTNAESNERQERSIKDLLGWYSEPKVTSEAGTDILQAKFHLLTSGPAAPVAAMIKEAATKGNLNLVGISIRGVGDYQTVNEGGRIFDRVFSIKNLLSADLVTRPAAGGKLLSLAESLNEELRRFYMELEKMSVEELLAARPDLKNLFSEAGPYRNIGFISVLKGDDGKLYYTDDVGDVYPLDDYIKKFTDVADEEEEAEEVNPLEEKPPESSETIEPVIEQKDDDKEDPEDKNKDDEDKKKRKMKETAPEQETQKEAEEKMSEHTEDAEVKESAQAPVSKDTILEEALKPINDIKADMVRMQERYCASLVESELSKVRLPDVLKDQVRKTFAGKVFEESELTDVIAEQVDIFDKLFSNQGEVGRQFNRVQISKTPAESVSKRLEATLYGAAIVDPDGTSYEPYSGLIEAYYSFNGQVPTYPLNYQAVSNMVKESHGYVGMNSGGLLQEATVISTTWSTVLGNTVNRVLLRHYSEQPYEWRWATSQVVMSRDLRPYTFSRLGGYTQPPSVAEGGTYQEESNPSEEAVTITPVKYGTLQPLTLEAILRDDVRAFQRVPLQLAAAFKMRQFATVFDLLANNTATEYDSLALSHTTHANNSTVALSGAEIATGIRLMRSQTPPDATDRPIGLRPRYLIVPNELEEHAYRLVTSDVAPGSNPGNAPNSAQPGNGTEPNIMRGKYGLQLVVMDYWTDVSDWWLMADPRVPGTETLGVVVGPNGVEPTLDIQDEATVSSVFTADKITFKVRGWFAADILDHRPFVGGIVA